MSPKALPTAGAWCFKCAIEMPTPRRSRASSPSETSSAGVSAADMSRSLWLFGYGSLIWRPGFDYEKRVPGFVKGWARRFWQGSTDHRGTPEAPGRVVTLVEAPGASCWGVAYRLRPSTAATVLERLDHREQGGYERHQVVVTPKSPAAGSSIHALVYIAGRNNPDYLGPAPLSEMAAQIRASH